MPVRAPSVPRLSPAEIDTIRRQLMGCWNVPTGPTNPADVFISVRVHVDPNGRLQDARVVETSGSSAADVELARASVLEAMENPGCWPLRAPAEKYERWKSFHLVYNPVERSPERPELTPPGSDVERLRRSLKIAPPKTNFDTPPPEPIRERR